MALRDDVLPIISAGWGLVQTFGFSKYTVTVRTITWDGGEVGLGEATNSDLTLSPNPQCKETNGGSDLQVYAITPSFSGGGYTLAQLRPTETVNTEYRYIVTGENGTHEYQLYDIDTSDPVEYKLTLKKLTRSNPD